MKQDGYARFSWPHPRKDNGEGDGLLCIIDMEFWTFLSVQELHFTSLWYAVNMITRGWWHWTVWTGRPFSQDPRNAREISMKVVSFENYAWRSGLGKLGVCIFTRCYMVAPLLNWLLLLLLPFLLLLSHLVTSITTFTKWRGRRGGRNKWRRRRRVNSSINWLMKNHGILNDRGWE